MISKSIISLLGGLSLLSQVSGHDYINTFTVDGVSYNASQSSATEFPTSPSAAWFNNLGSGWVGQNIPEPAPHNFSSLEYACGSEASPGSLTVTVPAGSLLEFQYSYTFIHQGSVAFYMADCLGECQKVNIEQLEWFKIKEEGLEHQNTDGTKNESSRVWATRLHDKETPFPIFAPFVTIPSTLSSGNYILRIEISAVHHIWEGEIQLYPYCFNTKVTGTGTAKPKGVVTGKLYNPTDFLFSETARNITWEERDDSNAPIASYIPPMEWTIQGPPVWDGK